MHPIELFVRSPVKVAVGVLLVCLFGAISIYRMPMQLTPEVQIPTISITTTWPGASPQEVEKEIIQEQEEQLKGVEGVTKLTSEAQDSQGIVTLEFSIGTNMSEALLLVNSRLQQVQEYPEDADEPVISTSSSSNTPIAWFVLGTKLADAEEFHKLQEKHPALKEPLDKILAIKNPALGAKRLEELAKQHPEVSSLLPPDNDIDTLRRFTEDVIEAQFERVPGVANSNVFGGRDPEVQVIVDPERLAARQLTIQQVRAALRGQNQDTSAGDFWEGKRRYVVRTLGQFRSTEQVEEQLLAVVDGAPVYIRDVAEVRLSFKKPNGFVRRYGRGTIAVNCLRETGANVMEVMRGLQEETKILNERILHKKGLVLTQVYDETEYIDSAVGLVNDNIWVGGGLTLLVLFAFLRDWRSTVVVGLTIPISVIGAFLIMYALGRSLNVISLAGLAFAIGMLVDNSVVVLDNVFRYYQQGESPWSASIRGTKEVWLAVLVSALCNLAVFLPVMFIPSEAGQLFRDIALAISGAIGLSLFVTIIVVPLGASRLLKAHSAAGPDDDVVHQRNKLMDAIMLPLDHLASWAANKTVGINIWALRSTPRQLLVIGSMMAASFFFTWLLWPPVEYLPSGNRNLVFGVALPPPGYNLNTLSDIGKRVEKHIEPYWNIDPDSPEAKNLKYPPIEDFFYVASGRQVFLGLRSAEPLRARELIPLVMELQTEIPGTFVVAQQFSLFEQGLTAGRTIDVEISGPDLERLVEVGGRVLGQVMIGQPNPTEPEKSIPPVIPGCMAMPLPSLDLSNPEVHVKPRLLQARDLGINTEELGYTVNALVDGAYATDFYPSSSKGIKATLDSGAQQEVLLGTKKIDIVIIGEKQYAQRIEDLNNLPIATPDGTLVKLMDVAEVSLSSGPEQINHRERQRAITIQVRPPPEMPLETAINLIETQVRQPILQEGILGPEYSINLRGTADKLNQTWADLKWNLALAVLITYLLMAALYESWLYPFVIIVSLPLGAVGGVAALQLLSLALVAQGQPPQMLDVITMLGFIILVGNVVNNATLLVDQALIHMREDGMSPSSAIIASIRNRIRPIFMTMLTAVFGLSPLVVYPGAGSELYRGLGAVLLGGLSVSAVFTLVFIPSLFNLTMNLRARVMHRRPEEPFTPVDREGPLLAESVKD